MFWIIVGSLIGYLIYGYFGMCIGGFLGFALLAIFLLRTINENLLNIKSDISNIHCENYDFELSRIASAVSDIKLDISSELSSIESELSGIDKKLSDLKSDINSIESNVSKIESCNYECLTYDIEGQS